MGSGVEHGAETAAVLRAQGDAVGVLQVRLYRPFSAEAFLAALPQTCAAVAVLEQTKEPGPRASRSIRTWSPLWPRR